jgi:hypothetical protein
VLTYNAGPNGSISGTTPQNVPHGGTGTEVTAVPNLGYHFVKWSDDVATAARTDGPVTANLTVTAEFALNEYTLTYLAGPNGSITGTTPQTVPHGGSGSAVTAVPNVGYHFVKWSDDVLTATRTDGPVTADVTVTAQFAEKLVVVSQIFGGGGQPGAPHTHDYVELFNRGDHPVDITDWTVQYAAATSTVWTAMSLSGVIQPHSYFLVQQATSGGVGSPLPAPDETGSIDLNGFSGKVALVSSLSTLTGSCPSVPAIEDLVGYGSATCSETSPAPELTNQLAALRDFDGCIDTGNNAQDFSAGTPTPRNSASPANDCLFTLTVLAAPSDKGSVTKSPDQAGYTPSSQVQITAVPIPGYHFDHWSGGASGSCNPLTVEMISDLTITAHFVSNDEAGQMVISQYFGGGGVLPQGLKNDYVELFNRGNGPVDVTGWTIQFAAATSSVWNATPLIGVVEPGHYFLVQLFTSGQGDVDLPTPDAIGALDLDPTQGKLALVSNDTDLTGICPGGIAIKDLVGYGAANCSETAPAASSSNTEASFRGDNGCRESNNNQGDFANGAPDPRNSAHDPYYCKIWLDVGTAPTQLSLGLPMPNPSRGQFNFSVALPVEGMVRVTVSDVQGRRVASLVNGNMPAGRHNLSWNGAGDAGPVRPGLYYLALENKGQRLVRRFVIIR